MKIKNAGVSPVQTQKEYRAKMCKAGRVQIAVWLTKPAANALLKLKRADPKANTTGIINTALVYLADTEA